MLFPPRPIMAVAAIVPSLCLITRICDELHSRAPSSNTPPKPRCRNRMLSWLGGRSCGQVFLGELNLAEYY